MNVLLTSVGRRNYMPVFLREAGCDKVIGINLDKNSVGLANCDKSYISPAIYDDNYLDFVIDICKKEEIDFVLPLFDIDLPVLSANRFRFDEIGVDLIVGDCDSINVCNDKYEMHKFLYANSFDTPKLVGINDAEFGEVLIKPRWGMGSLSIYKVDGREFLSCFYKKALKDVRSSYLKYESSKDFSSSILIQEFIKGTEYGLDIICDLNKKYVTTVVREKIAMRSGETDIAKVIKNEQLSSIGEKLASVCPYIGNMDVDIIVSGEKAYIIDMNLRFGGGYPFTHYAGINTVKFLCDCIYKKRYLDSNDFTEEKDNFLKSADHASYNKTFGKCIGMCEI